MIDFLVSEQYDKHLRNLAKSAWYKEILRSVATSNTSLITLKTSHQPNEEFIYKDLRVIGNISLIKIDYDYEKNDYKRSCNQGGKSVMN